VIGGALPESAAAPPVNAHQPTCTPEQRRDELRALQERVVQAAPRQLDSLEKAVQPGGPLAGWQLPHGHVVLAGAGAVALHHLEPQEPLPPLLLYAPSPASSPADWLDLDGPDGPYRLIGWGFVAPYRPGSAVPSRRCIAATEWFVHEAGWHLTDGGMRLTPGAASEPPRPMDIGILFWHPAVWDIHFWVGDDGVPTVALHNPRDPGGGMALPDGGFYALVDGRKQRLPGPRGR